MAKFQVHEVFRLPIRQQFVMAGTIVEGVVRPGKHAMIILQDKLTWSIPIAAVEFIDRLASAPEKSLVGLVFAEQSSEDASLPGTLRSRHANRRQRTREYLGIEYSQK